MPAIYYRTSTAGGGGGAPTDARYLTLTTDGTLTQERVFTAGVGLTGTDGGAGSTYTVDLDHLGLEALADPNADRLIGWDDSAGNTEWITISTGLTLTGTTLTASGAAFDISALGTVTPVLGDLIAFADVSNANSMSKTTLTAVNAIIDHDATLNFVADEHIAHSSITLTAGVGLSGGGTIAANRTFTLDLSELTDVALASGDYLAIEDVTDNSTKKANVTDLHSVLNHDSFTGFVANEHIDWTSTSSNLNTSGTVSATTSVSSGFFGPVLTGGTDYIIMKLDSATGSRMDVRNSSNVIVSSLGQYNSNTAGFLRLYTDNAADVSYRIAAPLSSQDTLLIEKVGSTNPACILALMTHDQDATSDCFFSARSASGYSFDSGSNTNYSNLVMGWIAAEGVFAVKGTVAGSGTARRVEIYTNNHTGQLAVETDGGVSIAIQSTGTLNISGLPTSSAGLSTGDCWLNSGVLTVV